MNQNRGKEETAAKYRQVIGTSHSSNKLTRRLFDCTDRKESNELFLTIDKLHKNEEEIMRKCDKEINDLRQILHNLELEREGSAPFRKLIEGDELQLKSVHETGADAGDCLDIKSIRRPLVPITPRNHGIQVHVNHELLSKACAVPHRIRAKIVRREAVRLNKMENLKLCRHPEYSGGTQKSFGISEQVGAYSTSCRTVTNTEVSRAKSGYVQGTENDHGETTCPERNRTTIDGARPHKEVKPIIREISIQSQNKGKMGIQTTTAGVISSRKKVNRSIPQIRVTSDANSLEIKDEWVEERPQSFPAFSAVAFLENPEPVAGRERTTSRPPSASKLQTIVNEKVLSPRMRGFSSKQKTKRLVDYVRILRQYLGTADDRPNITEADSQYLRLTGRRWDSPDFTETPFINVGKNTIIERNEEENAFKTVAKQHLDSLVALRNQLSGIPTSVSFPPTVDESKVQGINARLPAFAVGSAAGVILTEKPPDRFERLRKHYKETPADTYTE